MLCYSILVKFPNPSHNNKQAYTIELEHKVLRLEEENAKLRRQKV